MAHVNDQSVRALIDTGSLADFMSLTLVEQLQLEHVMLEKPLTIQLAIQGSRLKVNFSMKVHFQYQGTDYTHYFDVINLQSYDMILGTLFLYQHQVMVGLNSPRVVLGSKVPLEMKGTQVSMLKLRAMEVYKESLEQVHDVSQSAVLGRFYNPNTTPKDKERVVVCLRRTGQELH